MSGESQNDRSSGTEKTTSRRNVLRSMVAGTGTATFGAYLSSNRAAASIEDIDIDIYNFRQNNENRADYVEDAVISVGRQVGASTDVRQRKVNANDYYEASNWEDLYNDFNDDVDLWDGTVHYLIYDRKDMEDWNRGYGHGGEGMPFADSGEFMYESNKAAVAFLDADLLSKFVVGSREYKNIAISELGRTMMDKDESPSTLCGKGSDINSFGEVGPKGGFSASPLITGKTGFVNIFDGGSDDAEASCADYCSDPPRAAGVTGTLSACTKDEIERWLKNEY